ncbi:DDE-type integrase/transposase/recombinase [Haloterrigena sp. SYSU A121-1]|uniref:DDE-type integrase/transposase/recombinase n=1 Tax=Haloterrigena gelatinilytica TaxID=2741724 RepID=A0A8J8GPU0_9EURY|nr:DDE-type integrase/transposase/recombinase [Haloterrigena gelatinilytica]
MVGESNIRPDSRTLRVLRTTKPSRIAIDETAVKINGNWSWVYTAISIGSRLLFDVAVFGRRGTDSAVAFHYRSTEKYDPRHGISRRCLQSLEYD